MSLFSRGKPIRNRQGKKGPSTAESAVEKEGDWETSSDSVQEVFQSRRGENCPFVHSVRNQLFKLPPLVAPSRKTTVSWASELVRSPIVLENICEFVLVNLRVYYYDERKPTSCFMVAELG